MASNKKVQYQIEAQDKTKQGIDSSIKNLLGLDDAVKSLGKRLTEGLKIAALLESLKKLGEFAYDCIEEFGEFERIQLSLNAALGNNSDRIDTMNGLIDSLSEKTLASRQEVMRMTQQLAAFGRSDADIKKISTAAVYLSNVTGQSLTEAMKQVNATFSGSTDELGKLIPELKSLSKEQLAAGSATDVIMQKLGGLSDQMAQGVSQKIKNMKDSWAELKVELGKNLAETFSPLIEWIGKVGKEWTENLKSARAYKEYQDSINSGGAEAAKALPLDTQLRALQVELDNLQTLKRSVMASFAGGAQTPEQYATASGGDVSLDAAKKTWAIFEQNPQIVKYTQQIDALTAQIADVKGKIADAAKAPSAPSGAGTPAASPYSEAFATFMARMKESAAQWASYNELMEKGMSAAQIQEAMVQKFAVTSPSSPSAADWSRLNANNAAGTTGVPELYTKLLKSIFDDPEAIKAAQDAARKLAEDEAKAAEERKKANDALLAYTTQSNTKYMQSLAILLANKANYDDLYVQLDIEKENAIAEAHANGLTETYAIEAYYAERRRQLDEEVAAKRFEDAKKALEAEEAARQKALADAIAAAQKNGLFNLGQNNIGFSTYNKVSSLGSSLSTAGAGISGGGGFLSGIAGGAVGGLGELMSSLAGPIGSLVGMISSLGPVMQIMQPMQVILQGVMQVLGPIINDLLKPLLGILTIVGRVIGGLLSPALLLLKPIIEAISVLFIWLYNNVIVPIYNDIMGVFNWIYNAFADFINGILWLVDQIPFVDVGRVSYRDATEGFLETIDLADLSEAGDSVSSGTSSSASSASYTQGRTINMTFNENAITVGDGGIRQLAVEIRRELINLEQLGA